MDKKIGIFDSGLGGLSILKEILRELPEYSYVYLGDNARVPYGGRSTELIYQFTKQAVDFLFENNCQLIILACNSATASSLRKIQQEYLPKHYPRKKVLGVIRPAVEKVIELKAKRVGVIGTYATVNSKSFVHEIKKLNPQVEVYQNAAPLLVPIIEEDEINWAGCDLILRKYLDPLIKKKIDTLILGCTHYGLIADKIQKIIGKNVNVITEGEETAEKLKNYLKRHAELERQLIKNMSRQYFVTDLNERYKKMAELFLGRPIPLTRSNLRG